MMLNKLRVAAVALGALALTGCANDPYGSGPREGAGTAVGALTGAVIGSAFGRGTGGRIGGAVAGAAIGGLIGNRIGASMDEEDRRMAYEAEMAALEQGQVGSPYGWTNPGSSHYGNIVPGPVYVQRGSRCRTYTHTVYVGGQPEVVRGTACRNPDGTWTALS